MQTEIPLLQNVKVAAPCPTSWSAMKTVDGDRVKFCDACSMNVYNLSALTQAQAEGLLRTHEGRLCVRYFMRSDGTVITANCPVGVQAVRHMFVRRSVTTAALFILGLVAMAAMQTTTVNETATVVEGIQHMTGAASVPGPVKRPVPEPPKEFVGETLP